MIPAQVKYDPNATPPQFTDNEDYRVEPGTHIRVKIMGTRSEVGEMWAIGTINEDYLGYVPLLLLGVSPRVKDGFAKARLPSQPTGSLSNVPRRRRGLVGWVAWLSVRPSGLDAAHYVSETENSSVCAGCAGIVNPGHGGSSATGNGTTGQSVAWQATGGRARRLLAFVHQVKGRRKKKRNASRSRTALGRRGAARPLFAGFVGSQISRHRRDFVRTLSNQFPHIMYKSTCCMA
jgi:hypothetical protein